MSKKRQDILVIADRPNWAYYQIQQFILNNLSDDYNIFCDHLCYNGIKKSKRPSVIIQNFKDKKKYRNVRSDKKYDLVVYLGFYFLDIIKIDWESRKTIVGIFTDGYPPRNGIQFGTKKEFIQHYFDKADAMICGAPSILDLYKDEYTRAYFANLAYDTSLFKRLDEKQINESKFFTIGFTGQLDRDFKGFYTHIVPAVNRLKSEFPNVTLKTRSDGPFETLPRFYDDVDVVVIASEADAGPSLFMEASLMEVPSISTRIGIVTEVLENGKNGYFVEREINDIYEKLKLVMQDRNHLFSMSSRIRKDYIKKLGPSQMKEKWNVLFKKVLND